MDRKDKEAILASLYDEYFDKIAGYAFARLGERAAAEDLAGNVFLKALESLDSYQERGIPMQAWLFKIAHNLVIDYRRKEFKKILYQSTLYRQRITQIYRRWQRQTLNDIESQRRSAVLRRNNVR